MRPDDEPMLWQELTQQLAAFYRDYQWAVWLAVVLGSLWLGVPGELLYGLGVAFVLHKMESSRRHYGEKKACPHCHICYYSADPPEFEQRFRDASRP